MMKMMMMTIMGKFVERAHNRETGKGTRRYLAMLENGNWGPGWKRALHRTRGPEVSPNIIQMWNQLLKRNMCLLSVEIGVWSPSSTKKEKPFGSNLGLGFKRTQHHGTRRQKFHKLKKILCVGK